MPRVVGLVTGLYWGRVYFPRVPLPLVARFLFIIDILHFYCRFRGDIEFYCGLLYFKLFYVFYIGLFVPAFINWV